MSSNRSLRQAALGAVCLACLALLAACSRPTVVPTPGGDAPPMPVGGETPTDSILPTDSGEPLPEDEDAVYPPPPTATATLSPAYLAPGEGDAASGDGASGDAGGGEDAAAATAEPGGDGDG